MGCAPTARTRNLTPAGKNELEANASTITSKLIQDLSSGKMSKANYDKMLKMDIKVHDDFGKPLQVQSMDYRNKEHLAD